MRCEPILQSQEFRSKKLPGLDCQGYISELDGLRAVAVVLVLFTHFGPQAETGSFLWKLENAGWIGVDLFFVLSGFLITGIRAYSQY